MDFIVIALVLAGLYMAWNIGANDLANAMGTSVGTGALSLKQVIVIAAFFEFFGAVLFGSRVTETIASGIVPVDIIGTINPNIVAFGMLAAILAAGFWVTLTTFYNLPVSTSHSIVGSVLGFGLIAAYNGTISFLKQQDSIADFAQAAAYWMNLRPCKTLPLEVKEGFLELMVASGKPHGNMMS
jgi:PiT family inorganic phosphate transporter